MRQSGLEYQRFVHGQEFRRSNKRRHTRSDHFAGFFIREERCRTIDQRSSLKHRYRSFAGSIKRRANKCRTYQASKRILQRTQCAAQWTDGCAKPLCARKWRQSLRICYGYRRRRIGSLVRRSLASCIPGCRTLFCRLCDRGNGHALSLRRKCGDECFRRETCGLR